MTQLLDGCMFCHRTESVIAGGTDFFVQLDDAPIVEGHALVMPRAHYPSIADLPARLRAQLDGWCAALKAVYLEVYGAFALFEHGRTGHCLIRTSQERICHHAHVHVLPLQGDIVQQIQLGQRVHVSDWESIAELAEDIDGYLVAESISSGRVFFPVTSRLPPHHLRTLAAGLAGDGDLADWERMLGTRRSRDLIASAERRLADHARDLPTLLTESMARGGA
ncbi:HIT family protein [Catellatospora chokoriensis]|uniref:HIT domain-containing protein n=1 Tax=Catellatospora chokoriensis TaxID=310353 RepID=A0A8J3K367_9ACTN|nr:HIT domain-containing protein [Catellatospora chokoriensis]GIF87654.1 hypothetical protein Cch02nite_10980 [Catellatospora chokoriensis]